MYKNSKRLLDIFIASFALLLFSPLFIVISILLKFSGEGYVFYFQERIGLNNQPFSIWKFATMLKDSLNMTTGDVTVKNDPRVLPMGNFLRKTKINELPQIINVLIGNMSIVGARPLVKRSVDMYADEVKAVIYNSPPGITGIGSLVFRDEETIIDQSGQDPRAFYEQYILPHKGKVEMWYQENKSLWTDIKIIFLTAWVIIFPNSGLVYTWFPDLPKRIF
jgi:lipopolysaccharide/colanic/teichoic acid biosynthesis glycosyltransferase